MSALDPIGGYSKAVLGLTVNKAYPLVTETKTLFTVSGLVLVTSIVGLVTTVITVANTVKLQANPTVGTTQDLCAATDIGTTDTPAGDIITITTAPAESLVLGVGAVPRFPVTEPAGTTTNALTGGGQGIYIAAGTIEQVTTGSSPDGAITWYVTYVPIQTNATVS